MAQNEANANTPTFGSINQHAWLHVQPENSYLDVQLQLQLTNLQSNHFLVETSPNIALIPADNKSSLASAEYLPGQKKRTKNYTTSECQRAIF